MHRQINKHGQRVHLHRALSKLGCGSRTQAWEWIRAGKVRIDGRVVTDPLTWVDWEAQTVTIDGRKAEPLDRLVLALHKPKGVVTTRRDERGRRTIYDLLPPGLPWVFAAGRLDADSEGLLIVTNDSALSNALTDPERHVPKTYEVTIDAQPLAEDLERLRSGIELSDGPTRPARVRILQKDPKQCVLELVLFEGRNRQIRRMLAALGQRVRRLKRVAIGGFRLGDLPAGATRRLDKGDQERLLERSLRGGRDRRTKLKSD